MIDQATLITYLAILLGFVLIPGPAVLLTLTRSSTSGTRAGLATAFGIAMGDLIHTIMAVIGISAIILTSAFLFGVIKYLGAAYLVYLGLRAILAKSTKDQPGPQPSLTAMAAFRQAVLAEILNPKSALFFLAFLPQFVRPENGAVSLQLMTLGALFVLVGLLSTVMVAVTAARVGAFLRRNSIISRWQGRIVGTVYCGLGLRLALQEK